MRKKENFGIGVLKGCDMVGENAYKFKGQIKEVRVWKSALEVEALRGLKEEAVAEFRERYPTVELVLSEPQPRESP